MKQKWIAFFAVLTLCIAFPMSVFAASSSSTSSTIPDHRLQPRVVDNANLLTASEEQELEKYLDSISEELKFDIAVVTTDTINGKTPMAYADDFYDYNGYGYGDDRDGALLLVSMEDRDYWITTCGYGITAITDYGIDYLEDKFVSDLSDGDYADAFHTFGKQTKWLVEQARKGDVYDVGSREPFKLVRNIVIAAVAAVNFKEHSIGKSYINFHPRTALCGDFSLQTVLVGLFWKKGLTNKLAYANL